MDETDMLPSTGGEIAHQLVADMERLTMDRIGELSLANAELNLPYITNGKSIAALAEKEVGSGDSAIIIAAGPSIKRTDPIRQIKDSGYKGAIIATESAMLYCLRNDVVPDLVVSVDPHGDRIVRWFGDPTLTLERLSQDDYFRRQDMDEAFRDELKVNAEIISLLDSFGPKVRIALSTSSSHQVVARARQAGMDEYWWNPFFDDPDQPGSRTRKLWNQNRMPLLNAGGNVGTACWMMAHAALGKRHVALCGFDFSYYGDTPYENTQYYREALSLVGPDRLDEMFIHIHNPHLERDFFTDPAYMWYRECFISLVPDADCTTYNCTEGGILFGDGIEFEPLQDFLGRFS